MPRNKTIDGSDIGLHLELTEQCQSSKNPNDNIGVRSTSSRSSEIINRNSFKNSKEDFLQKRLSFEKASDPAINKSICSSEMKKGHALDSKSEENQTSNLTQHSVAQAGRHSRYCCDNVPVA